MFCQSYFHHCRAGLHWDQKETMAQLKEKRQTESHLWIQTVLLSDVVSARHTFPMEEKGFSHAENRYSLRQRSGSCLPFCQPLRCIFSSLGPCG